MANCAKTLDDFPAPGKWTVTDTKPGTGSHFFFHYILTLLGTDEVFFVGSAMLWITHWFWSDDFYSVSLKRGIQPKCLGDDCKASFSLSGSSTPAKDGPLYMRCAFKTAVADKTATLVAEVQVGWLGKNDPEITLHADGTLTVGVASATAGAKVTVKPQASGSDEGWEYGPFIWKCKAPTGFCAGCGRRLEEKTTGGHREPEHPHGSSGSAGSSRSG